MASVEQPGEREPAPEPLVLVQDLVNTVVLPDGDDSLRTPADLAAWAAARGIPGTPGEGPGEGPGGGFDDDAVAGARVLREALRAVCSAHAGVDVPPGTLAALDALLDRAPLRLAVDAAGGAVVRPADGLTGLPALTAAVAAAVATSVAQGTWPRLKACASDTCRWAYYDRSPAGRSRWCSMAVCGSRAKMRTYRRTRSGG